MTPEEILTAPTLSLKANAYFDESKVRLPNGDPLRVFLYQKRGVLMKLLRPYFILGDDVGLGKTLQDVVGLSYLLSQNPKAKAIVFAETVGIMDWARTLRWLTPKLPFRLITTEAIPDPTKRAIAFARTSARVILTTYSQVYDYDKYLLQGAGDLYYLTYDEPNVFKNTMSTMHQQVDGITARSKRCVGLTATIVENRLEEAFAILKIVTPGVIPSLKYFQDHFLVEAKTREGRTYVKGYKNLNHFRELIQPVYLGRADTDPEVEQDLPQPLPKELPVLLGKEQSQIVMEADQRLMTFATGEVKSLNLFQSLTYSQQALDDPRVLGFDVQGAKMRALKELLEGTLKGVKTIVFSWYRRVIDQLERDLTPLHLKYGRITGAEDAGTRDQNKLRFQNEDTNLLLGTRAILKSHNLQQGRVFIFIDLPWSFGLYRQGVGRIRRTGSPHKNVDVWWMTGILHPEVAARAGSAQTLDAYRVRVINKKSQLFKGITGKPVDQLEGTTEDEDVVLTELTELIQEITARRAA